MDLLPVDWDVPTLVEAIAGGVVDGVSIGVLFVVLLLMRVRS